MQQYEYLNEIRDTVGDAEKILNDANLKNLSPTLFRLAGELRALSTTITVGMDTGAQGFLDNYVGLNYITDMLKQTEYAFTKIAKDSTLSVLINDRICETTRVPNALGDAIESRDAYDFTEDIGTIAQKLTRVNADLNPIADDIEQPDTLKPIPNSIKFKDTDTEIRGLKGAIAMESRGRS